MKYIQIKNEIPIVKLFHLITSKQSHMKTRYPTHFPTADNIDKLYAHRIILGDLRSPPCI